MASDETRIAVIVDSRLHRIVKNSYQDVTITLHLLNQKTI